MHKCLKKGLNDLNVDISFTTQQRLIQYIELLDKWNRSFSLTSISSPEQMVKHHLLDPLTILPLLREIKILADIGSGAGIPGLVLAIACKDLQIQSVEVNQKKCAFQEFAISALELSNVQLHQLRVENWQQEIKLDAVISRGFSNLSKFAALTGRLLKSGGRLIAMKGPRVESELLQLSGGWQLIENHEVRIPGLEARRFITILEKI